MRIFRAIGLGILIVILGFLVPEVLHEAERTAVLFLRGAGVSATAATGLIEQATSSPSLSTGTLDASSTPVAPRRLSLPQAPQVVRF
jgi:hypothetical protein